MSSLAQRIQQRRHIQERARLGAPGDQAGVPDLGAPLGGGAGAGEQAAVDSGDPLIDDFEPLLLAIGGHFGYAADDFEMMRSVAKDRSAAGLEEIERTIRQWRSDVVVNNLVDQLPEGARARALGISSTGAEAPRMRP